MASSSSLPSSLSLPPVKKDEVTSNWAELPKELMSSIMLRLSVLEKLQSAQSVCTSWLRVCKDPLLWREIDMRNLRPNGDGLNSYLQNLSTGFLEGMCRRAVDLSQGGLLEIRIEDFGSYDLLNYIADRSNNLKCLELAHQHEISSFELSKAVVKLPFLEELNLSYYSIREQHLKAIGQACPSLKTLELNYLGGRQPRMKCDNNALAISETMPSLRHLKLFGNELSDTGLNAILDNCPHLEHLDLRRCIFVKLVGDMEKKCFERIKVVRRPNDCTVDHPFYFMSSDSDSDDYAYGGESTIDSSYFDHFVRFNRALRMYDYDPYGGLESDFWSDHV